MYITIKEELPMKENTESINQNVFTHFPTIQASHSLPHLFLSSLKKKSCFLKDHILNSLITLGIGTIFLVTMYLFMVQLAEHGWQ